MRKKDYVILLICNHIYFFYYLVNPEKYDISTKSMMMTDYKLNEVMSVTSYLPTKVIFLHYRNIMCWFLDNKMMTVCTSAEHAATYIWCILSQSFHWNTCFSKWYVWILCKHPSIKIDYYYYAGRSRYDWFFDKCRTKSGSDYFIYILFIVKISVRTVLGGYPAYSIWLLRIVIDQNHYKHDLRS